MKRKVAIRVDASVAIGTGHVTRCLSLARNLENAEITFVSREHAGNLCDWLETLGFAVLRLPPPPAGAAGNGYAAWLGVSEEQDAADTLAALGACDALVVDHYGLGRAWESRLRSACGILLAIDDLANREHDCDVLLDQNLREGTENPYLRLCPPACEFLLGPRYALLSPAFAASAGGAQGKERVFVFFGGSDLSGETMKALHAIGELGRPNVKFDVLVGKNNPRLGEIRDFARTLPAVSLTEQMLSPSEMIERMSQACLALGAGGTTSWERCCLGLPSLVVSVAENQIPGAAAMAEALQHLYLGESAKVTAEDLGNALRFALDHPELTRAIRRNNLSLVDGRGALRAAAKLLPPFVHLRPATESDSDLVHAWRNAPAARAHSFDVAEIPLENHRRWFSATLANPARLLLIADGVGVLRYDLMGEEALVSIYLAPGQQGRGYGTALLRAGTRWLQKNQPGVQGIRGEVKRENLASQNAFRAAGFDVASYGFKLRIHP